MIALLAVTSMFTAQAQEKPISSVEFVLAEHAADAQFVSKQNSARWTIVTESRLEGRAQTDFTSRTVMEFGPNGSRRRSSESTFGGKSLKNEIAIKVGDKNYLRIGDKSWKEAAIDKNCDLAKETKEVSELRVAYKYLGSGVFDGRKARRYLRSSSREETDKATGAVSRIEDSTSYWFGENGDYYRSEYHSVTKTGIKVSHTNITIEKQLDPSISIDAPGM